MFITISIISTVSASLTVFVSTLLWSVRRSRCVDLECFIIGARCCICKRELMDLDELEQDTLAHATIGTSVIDEDEIEESKKGGRRSRRNSVAF